MKVCVKICGLSDEAALESACAAGADAVGFVLAPSPRKVTLERARELLARVPAGIERVAVLARATRAEIEAVLVLEIDAVQAEVGSGWPKLRRGVFALPALRDGPEVELRARVSTTSKRAEGSLRGALVLDGPRGGGRGEPVDLARAAWLAAQRPIVLAGGLTPANVAERIRAVRPFAVDVSSGVERERGRKDPALVRAFVEAVRELEREGQETQP